MVPMALTARATPAPLAPRTRHLLGQRRLGDILVHRKCVAPGDLLKALALQRVEDALLGEILIGNGLISAYDLQSALAEQSSLPLADLQARPPDPHGLQGVEPLDCLRLSFVPWQRVGGNWIIAAADPAKFDEIRTCHGMQGANLSFALAPQAQIQSHVARIAGDYLSDKANTRCPARFSCRSWAPSLTVWLGGGLLAITALSALLFPQVFFTALMAWILIALLANTGLKLACFLAHFKTLPSRETGPDLPRAKLPKVSILVPLLHEHDILPRLMKRVTQTTYPRELLEVCLIHEASDQLTRTHLAEFTLPGWIRTLEVPQSSLQTKPRAMNYALDFCNGDVIGIYDAEDAPEPDQIYKMVAHLANAGPRVACVQGILDFYNARTNWISRCFTIEYAILFRVILRGISRLGLPLPLGGTSVFFRRKALEDLGRWDSHNVTEDADLGMRLARMGYSCNWVESVTYEEANFRALPWVKQRSRWLKGFLQTWVTHVRHPVQLWRDLGPVGFVTFNILFLGTFTSYLTAPVVWPFWLASFGVDLPVLATLDPVFLRVVFVLFIASEAFAFVLALTALRPASLRSLRRWAPMMILYWPIGSLAAYKALYELFAAPDFWDKTQHGINDASHAGEIDRLTSQGPQVGNVVANPFRPLD
jgi:cellulose synthase/poly-beta-1,6-N-acetylglucosamine synthase-like glycosyltransferase